MVALISYYPTSLADSPAGSSSIVTAVVWLQDMLLGTVATSIAVIAVAAIGFGMLTGRVNIRYGVTVVMGCFILFGASSIVSGLRQAAAGATGGDIASGIEAPSLAGTPRPTPSPAPAPGPAPAP